MQPDLDSGDLACRARQSEGRGRTYRKASRRLRDTAAMSTRRVGSPCRRARLANRSRRLEVADGDAEYATVGGLHHGGNAVAWPGDRHNDLAGAGARELCDAAHDIDMREGPPAIL